MNLKITYDNGITQIFKVYTREEYETKIVPLKDMIWSLECYDAKEFRKHKKLYNDLKSLLKSFGKFCVVGSPIYNSVKTQILSLPSYMGGDSKVVSKLF